MSVERAPSLTLPRYRGGGDKYAVRSQCGDFHTLPRKTGEGRVGVFPR